MGETAVNALVPLGNLHLPSAEVGKWREHAHPGDRLTYYRGFLAVDRDRLSRLASHDRVALSTLADYVMSLASAGSVCLVQQRHGIGDYSYIVVENDRSGFAR
jgi:hypothetical protein